jgi:hypothetical protein
MTLLGSRLLVLGGTGPLGPLADAHLLQSPAVQRGLRLQIQALAAQQLLSQAQDGAGKLRLQLTEAQVEAAGSRRQLQVRNIPLPARVPSLAMA